ncbi:MAG: prolipoprotein diacylglyceryl transferase family protein, partial [Planctomycetota bacterium]
GCCHGFEGDGFLCLDFAWTGRRYLENAKALFPVQLLDMLVYSAIAVLLLILYRKRRLENRLFILFLLLFSAGRFLSEFTRGDNIGGKAFYLSPVQVILIVSILVSAVLFLWPKIHNGIFRIFRPKEAGETGDVEIQPEQEKKIRRIGKYAFVVLLFYQLMYYTMVPAALFLLFVFPLLKSLFDGIRNKRDAVSWCRLYYRFMFFSFGFFYLSTAVLASFLPFYIGFVMFMIILILMLNRCNSLVRR